MKIIAIVDEGKEALVSADHPKQAVGLPAIDPPVTGLRVGEVQAPRICKVMDLDYRIGGNADAEILGSRATALPPLGYRTWTRCTYRV